MHHLTDRAVAGIRRCCPGGEAYGDLKVAMIFLAPATLGFVVFYIWPTLRGAYLSFTEYSLLSAPQFNGLDNYERMIAGQLLLERARRHGRVRRDQHRPADGPGDRHRDADVPADQIDHGPRGDPAAVPGRERGRRAGLVLDARLPGRHREPVPRPGSGSTRSRSSATPHWAIPTIAGDQRLAAHGLHGAAGVRRAADDPGVRLRGGRGGRRRPSGRRSGGSRCRCCGRSW